ncbi:MAG: hypothetical protein ACLSGX_00335 [Pseudoruminococcus massiliensis]|jgi:prophage DNA circulation protein|uniref:hypothetical protein n=1 Tax=Pseudoruminococcus massiliensis TaxID=2086583 RepID=UPI0020661FBA|nr:MAG TPA: hypothetical protein [Herelleviridae sp.]HJI56244.1 hypothetical protein [Oscillospiraceae bacterium]
MIASAQFTIISICDVVTSDTPPDNPYEGQLWVDTTVTPPETKVWNGTAWLLQNGMDTIRTEIATLKTKDAEFQQSVDGLNSYVSNLTETVETVSGEQGTISERVLKPTLSASAHHRRFICYGRRAVYRRHQLCAELRRT